MNPKLLVAVLGCALASTAVAQSNESIELVETVPVETDLDREDIRSTHAVWRDMIDGAQRRIDLAHFYASNRPGSRLETIVAAIEAAAQRGVNVRFLADAGFADTYPDTLSRLERSENIDVRELNLRQSTGGVLHAKFMVVDASDVYVGSANFDWRALEHIQELGVRIRSKPAARDFVAVFDFDWATAGGEQPTAAVQPAEPGFYELSFAGTPVRVAPIFSPKPRLPTGTAWDLPQITHLIDNADERVWIQLLSYRTVGRDGEYFAQLETALRSAAARGVDVRLLLADWSKRKGAIEGLQSLQALPNITVRMMCIPAASTGFVPFARVAHAKYMAIDGKRGWLGTSNWSRDYFFASRNAGVEIDGPALASRLERYFQRNWDSALAEQVDPAAAYEPPRIDK